MMFDNRENRTTSRERYAQEDAALLMCVRRGLPEHSGESEPVLVTRTGSEVVIALDDGEELVLDALELASAVQPRLRVAA